MKLKEGDLVLLFTKSGTSFLTRISKRTISTHLGELNLEDALEKEYGDYIETHKGEKLFLIKPPIGEFVRRLKRQTQIIFPKEAGYILMYLDIFPGAKVIECGTGSGSLTTILAQFVGEGGKVYSYERRKEFANLAEENLKKWGVSDRVEIKVKDIEEGFDEEGVDAVFLDLPTPWDYIKQVKRALLPGRHFGAICPTFNQVEKLVGTLINESFIWIRVLELLMREIRPSPGKIRPEDTMIAHTGFLVFATLVKDNEG
ncbi:MAG: tRNA (adenine-N1)-methyltransferase [Synergistetes bacterium]|nr:tRNA (adenine-N1)-methyltransferase [Synergistota bacterium]MDK2871731.1 tRNA (adenine57-N1/adenine58-N1)-methyltransferase catalytic subunit [bacterium]